MGLTAALCEPSAETLTAVLLLLHADKAIDARKCSCWVVALRSQR